MVTLTPELKLLQEKRRNDVLRLSLRGLTLDEVADGLKISRATALRDLRVRHADLLKEIKPVERVVAEASAAKNELVRELYKNYQTAEKPIDRCNILRQIWAIYRDFVRIVRPDIVLQQNTLNVSNTNFTIRWEDSPKMVNITSQIEESNK